METWKLDTPAHDFLIEEIKFKRETVMAKKPREH